MVVYESREGFGMSVSDLAPFFKLIALSVQVVHWNQRILYFYSLAIRVLEQQGLVEVIPKDGTYLTSFDSDQIKNGLHVRVALEQLALK